LWEPELKIQVNVNTAGAQTWVYHARCVQAFLDSGQTKSVEVVGVKANGIERGVFPRRTCIVSGKKSDSPVVNFISGGGQERVILESELDRILSEKAVSPSCAKEYYALARLALNLGTDEFCQREIKDYSTVLSQCEQKLAKIDGISKDLLRQIGAAVEQDPFCFYPWNQAGHSRGKASQECFHNRLRRLNKQYQERVPFFEVMNAMISLFDFEKQMSSAILSLLQKAGELGLPVGDFKSFGLDWSKVLEKVGIETDFCADAFYWILLTEMPQFETMIRGLYLGEDSHGHVAEALLSNNEQMRYLGIYLEKKSRVEKNEKASTF